jgi:2'-5' RNA ligase
MADSAQGRRVLVAVVTGDVGERIKEWREQHDPKLARRLPPHATLCYWLPDVALDNLDRQVRHAFPEPIRVRLGGVQEFDNVDRTFFVDVSETDVLDSARERLFDGAFVDLPAKDRHWTWHVTCVRNSVRRDLDALRAHAAELSLNTGWEIETIACLELRGGRYLELQRWDLSSATDRSMNRR